jgi:ABC-type multidrug transport system fused ATPase/permease subunit
MRRGTDLIRFTRYLLPYWEQEALILALLIAGTLTTLAPPYVMKVIIDDVFALRESSLLVPALAALFGATLVGVLAMFGVDYLYNWVSNRVMRDIRDDFFAHLIRLPQAFFQEQKAGDIIFRINNDVNQIQFILSASVLRLVHAVLVLVGISVMLCWLNVWLYLVALVAMPLFVLNVQYFQGRIRQVTEAGQRQHASIMEFFKERFENVKLIQCFRGHGHESGRLEALLARLIDINMEGAVYGGSMRAISTVLVALMPLLVFGWGGYQVMSGAMTLGAIIAFLNYLMRVFDPVQSLNGLYMDLVKAGVSMRRVMDFMSTPSELQLQKQPTVPLTLEGSLSFQGVSFGYSGTRVLDGLDLDLKLGNSYGLFGPSGCGKSTLVNLLLRFCTPDAGSIRVGGVDVQSTEIDELRRHMSLVPQETLLFHDTVEANIRYGSWEAPPAVRGRALTASGMDLLAGSLAGNGRSMVGDRGMQLSGGQKQRLAIARALMADAPLLVMDEATSALDAESERQVLRAVRQTYQGRTLLVISHRPDVLREMDEVICLKNGAVVERGHHDELLVRRGFYWRALHDRPLAETLST